MMRDVAEDDDGAPRADGGRVPAGTGALSSPPPLWGRRTRPKAEPEGGAGHGARWPIKSSTRGSRRGRGRHRLKSPTPGDPHPARPSAESDLPARGRRELRAHEKI